MPKTEDDLVDDWDYDTDDPDPDYDMYKHPEDIVLQLWLVELSDSEPVILKDDRLYVAS